MNNNNIQVSVCIVTYNQENYIAECLDSIVDQQTNFKFEVIVGEDCSTDNTRAIIQKYVEKYPELIVPIFYEKNVGAVENIKQVYKKAKGKYIAHLDGDDFALPGKLQKQFDILEANPNCSICVHNMDVVDSKGQPVIDALKIFEEKKYTLLDMYLINPFFIHSSKMFINKIEEYIDELDVNALDTELHIEQAKQGDIYFIGESLGIYRKFVGITYQNNFVSPMVRERIMYIYDSLNEICFSNTEVNLIKEKYALILLEYAYQCAISIKDKELFERYVTKSWEVKKIGITSYVFKAALLHPESFFILFNIRKVLRYRLRISK